MSSLETALLVADNNNPKPKITTGDETLLFYKKVAICVAVFAVLVYFVILSVIVFRLRSTEDSDYQHLQKQLDLLFRCTNCKHEL